MELILPSHVKKKEFKPSVTVKLKNQALTHDEYVVIAYDRKTNRFSISYNADPITMAVALEMVNKTFVDMYKELPPEGQAVLDVFLKAGKENG